MAICHGCGALVSERYCGKCFALNASFESPCLVGVYAPFEGKIVHIPAEGLRIGRAQEQNQFVIDDPELSRQHAILSLETTGAVRLISKGQNGTFINGQRVNERVLEPADEIRFGLRRENHFVFQLPGPSNLFRDPASGRLVPIRPDVSRHDDRHEPQKKEPGFAGVPRDTMYAAVAASPKVATVVMAQQEEAPQRRLQLVLDQYAVRDIPLDCARLEFGRAEGPGKLCIDHASISARHAELVIGTESTVLTDLGSKNGTFVNGEKTTHRVLQEGDLLQFGACDSHLFLYRESRRRVRVLRDVELQRDVTRIGRDRGNDIQLSHPTVSGRHAEVHRVGDRVEIVDRGSTNGTFVNGRRISKQVLQAHDRVTLGAVQFVFDGSQMEQQADGIGIHLLARDLRVEVKDFNTGAALRLLDDVSLAIQPCEFVGLLGPSGAGKSTLMDALNGSRPAQQGNVLLNSASLYREFDSLRALIGYVPQEDILHRQLTIRECLYYSAKLRLPDDFGESEIRNRVDEVIRMLDLGERAEITIANLSGGQRKRVSLGIELLSKPVLLFMDEPTQGQDPKTEMKMMQLFREIANRGSTVVLNTHLLGSFSLLDKVAVLVRGKLAYFGASQEMLPYFNAQRPHDIYDKLVDSGKKPEDWAAEFRQSSIFQESVAELLEEDHTDKHVPSAEPAKPPCRSTWRQLSILLSRQCKLKFKEKSTLFALFLPPALIALLMGFMKRTANEPKMIFMIVLVGLWFGCSSSVREIVDELPVYKRERQHDLRLLSYLGAKVIYLISVAAVQSLLFITVLSAMGALRNHLLECFVLSWLMTIEGGCIGLLISSIFSTAEKALYAFPLTMIPQLLLAGLLIPVTTTTSFYPVQFPDKHVEIQDAPPQFVQGGMSPVLKYVLSPLMVARWGLEALADLYIHDVHLQDLQDVHQGRAYSYPLLGSIAITLHPNDATSTRAQLVRKIQQKDPTPPDLGDSAFVRYLGILGGFVLASLSLTALMMKRKESHASRN